MKRRLWLNVSLVVVIVLILGGIVVAIRGTGQKAETQRTVTVARQTVTQTASATGSVVAPDAVTLAFTSAGVVTSVEVKAGDAVTKGQVLAAIDDTAASQQLASAESSLAQARSNAANAGSQLALTRQSVGAGNTALDQSVTQAESNLKAVQATWSDACANPDDPSCPNPSAAEAVRTAQNAVTGAQLSYDNAVQSATSNEITYNIAVNQATQNLASAKTYATDQCTLYGDASTQCHNAQDGITAKQQAYDTAVNSRTQGMVKDQQAVKSASMSLSNANVALRKTLADLRKNYADQVRQAKQALTNAKSAREKGRIANAQSLNSAQLAVSEFGGTSTSQAALDAAKAAYAVAKKAVDDTTLKAPVAGVVGAINVTVGETSAGGASATGSSGAVTIVPTSGFQVQADFAESDAAGLQVGQPATVTFEGLPGVSVTGSVLSIDPVAASSASNNLVTFAVRVSLDDAPTGLRQGMTANVSVTTATAENVLAAPQSAITTIGTTSTVEVLQADGTSARAEVTTGVQGDALTEITSGVAEGDTLVIPTAASTSGFPSGGIPGGGPMGGGTGGARRTAGGQG